MLDLVWRTVREAAWPGLVVLVAHAVLGEIFGHEPYVDPAMHFGGGVAAAFFFTRLPRVLPEYLGEPTPLARGLLGIGLTSAVAILWELGEHLSDVFLGTRIPRSVGNTMRDLVAGMLGASALVVGERMVRSNHTPNPRRQRSAAAGQARAVDQAATVERNGGR
jgi:hypothetical protein